MPSFLSRLNRLGQDGQAPSAESARAAESTQAKSGSPRTSGARGAAAETLSKLRNSRFGAKNLFSRHGEPQGEPSSPHLGAGRTPDVRGSPASASVLSFRQLLRNDRSSSASGRGADSEGRTTPASARASTSFEAVDVNDLASAPIGLGFSGGSSDKPEERDRDAEQPPEDRVAQGAERPEDAERLEDATPGPSELGAGRRAEPSITSPTELGTPKPSDAVQEAPQSPESAARAADSGTAPESAAEPPEPVTAPDGAGAVVAPTEALAKAPELPVSSPAPAGTGSPSAGDAGALPTAPPTSETIGAAAPIPSPGLPVLGKVLQPEGSPSSSGGQTAPVPLDEQAPASAEPEPPLVQVHEPQLAQPETTTPTEPVPPAINEAARPQGMPSGFRSYMSISSLVREPMVGARQPETDGRTSPGMFGSLGKRGMDVVRHWRQPASQAGRKIMSFGENISEPSRRRSFFGAPFPGMREPQAKEPDTNESTRAWLEWLEQPQVGSMASNSRLRGLRSSSALSTSPSSQSLRMSTRGARTDDGSSITTLGGGVFGMPLRRAVLLTRIAESPHASLRHVPSRSDLRSDSSSVRGAESPGGTGAHVYPSPDAYEHAEAAAPVDQPLEERPVVQDRSVARQSFLPRVVVRCLESLDKWGPDEEGIYRISGRSSHSAKLRALWDAPTTDLHMAEISPADLDVHSVCSVLKMYLRELPEPLVASELVAEFDRVCSEQLAPAETPPADEEPAPPAPGSDAARRAMRSLADLSSATRLALAQELAPLMQRIPMCQWYLLREIAEHLGYLADPANVTTTKMTLSNLTLVLAPTLQLSGTMFMALVQMREVLFSSSTRPACDALLDESREPELVEHPAGSVDPEAQAARPAPDAEVAQANAPEALPTLGVPVPLQAISEDDSAAANTSVPDAAAGAADADSSATPREPPAEALPQASAPGSLAGDTGAPAEQALAEPHKSEPHIASAVPVPGAASAHEGDEAAMEQAPSPERELSAISKTEHHPDTSD